MLNIILLFSILTLVKGQCMDCPLPQCNNLVYRMPAGGNCAGVQLTVGSLFESFDTCLPKSAVPHYCAYYEVAGARNDALNCNLNGTAYYTPWCYDYCQDTVACLSPSVTNNPQWQNCEQLSQNFSLPCAVVNSSVLEKYTGKNSSGGAIEVACPSYKDPVPANNTPSELGRLYGYLECPNCDPHKYVLRAQGNFSAVPLPLVYSDSLKVADLFPQRCSKYLSDAQIPGYGYWFYFWWPFSAIWLVLFTWRRKCAPISARNLILVYYSLITQQILFPLYLEPTIYQTTGSCMGATIFGTGLGVPILFTPIILRCWRLYYLYRWNQSKLDPKKVDWYFDHKYLLQPLSSIIALILLHALALTVAMVLYAASPDPYKEPTVLQSARCEWFIVTPEVEAYAVSVNASLVSFFNPTGKHIVHFSTCKFCDMPIGIKVTYTLLAQVFLWIGVFSLWSLRKLNDQYYLWKELNRLLLICMIAFPSAVPESFDSYREALQITPEINVVTIVVFLAFVWNFCWTCIYPTCLTFLPENMELTNKMSSTGSSATGSKGFTSKSASSHEKFFLKLDKKHGVNATVHNILLDPLGVTAFQGFCLEAFVVENAQFLITIRNYKVLPEKSFQKAQEAVRIYWEFIKEGSRLELNIAYTMRQRYFEIFEMDKNKTVPPDSIPLPNKRQSLLQRLSIMGARQSGIRGLFGLLGPRPSARFGARASLTDSNKSAIPLPRYSQRVPSSPEKEPETPLQATPPRLELTPLKEENEDVKSETQDGEMDVDKMSPSEGDVIVVGLTDKGHLRNLTAERLQQQTSNGTGSAHSSFIEIETQSPARSETPDDSGSDPVLSSSRTASQPITSLFGTTSGTSLRPSSRRQSAITRGGHEEDEDGLVVMKEEDKLRTPQEEPVDLMDTTALQQKRNTTEQNIIQFAEISFDDVIDEVKQLVSNDWPRFRKSKYWTELVREVTARDAFAPLRQKSDHPSVARGDSPSVVRGEASSPRAHSDASPGTTPLVALSRLASDSTTSSIIRPESPPLRSNTVIDHVRLERLRESDDSTTCQTESSSPPISRSNTLTMEPTSITSSSKDE